MEMTSMTGIQAVRYKEALKRYVMVFSELMRNKDLVDSLQENLKHLDENKKQNSQIENFMLEISDSRLEIESMGMIKN